jgi:hypothetical protein
LGHETPHVICSLIDVNYVEFPAAFYHADPYIIAQKLYKPTINSSYLKKRKN